jgi:hypothetical protein
MRRSDLDAMLIELREAAAIDPVHPERFYKAYRRVEAAAFYLSQDQIDELTRCVTTIGSAAWPRARTYMS